MVVSLVNFWIPDHQLPTFLPQAKYYQLYHKIQAGDHLQLEGVPYANCTIKFEEFLLLGSPLCGKEPTP